MRTRNIAILTCVILFVIFLANAGAQIPQTIQYEGKLGSKGKAVPDGAYSMKFTIYDSAAGGASLWTETQQVQVTAGLFSVLLGSVSPLNLSFDKQYWIGLSVNNDSEMTPRQTLSSVGYSFKAGSANYALTAGNADTVDNFHASSTPTADTLLPLNSNAKFPSSVIDTTGLNADTLDGFDSTSFQKAITGNCAGQVITAINADGTVSCEADDTGAGGANSNADTVDTFHASSTATANTLLPLDSNVKFPASVLPLITDSELSATANIAKSKLAPLAITDSDVSSISASKLNTTGATNLVTQIVAGTNVTISPTGGTGIVTINASGGGGGAGTVTSVGTGTGLTGGPITATGTVSIATGGVTSTEIADATITDADISATAAIAQSKINNLTADLAGKQNALGFTPVNKAGDTMTGTLNLPANGLTVGTTDVVVSGGNLLVGNPVVVDAKMSAEETGTSNAAGNFKINNALNVQPALYGNTNGMGNAGFFKIDNTANPSDGVTVWTTGGGTAMHAYTTGIGKAGYFEINNAINSDAAVYAYTNGTGGAGAFVLDNSASSNPAIFALTGGVGSIFKGDTAGTGNLLQLQKSGVDKFVVDNAGNITVGGVTDPNAVKKNPSSNQTIQPTADVVPLIIKDDAGATTDLLDVQNNAGTSLVKVNPSGNLLVGSPTVTGAKVSVLQTGTTNNAGSFEIQNASNVSPAVVGYTTGEGAAVYGYTGGIGNAGYFEIINVSNVNPAVYGKTDGTGAAVYGYTIGTGTAVSGNASGTAGSAGKFEISNNLNTSPIILGNITGSGTGNLLQLQKSGVDKFVVDNAGNITVGGVSDPNAVKKNPSAAQTIQPTADVVPLIIKDDAGATANLLDVQDNAGTSLVKVNPSGNLLVGNPATTNAKISALETGTTNFAGNFEINNASSVYPAVRGYTIGTGYAGSFAIDNASNTNPALAGSTIGLGPAVRGNANGGGYAVYGLTTGTGSAGYFEINNISNSSPALRGETMGTGYAGAFAVNNALSTASAVYAVTSGTGSVFRGLGTGTGGVFYGETTGTGIAGNFQINNVSNLSPLIVGNTTGTGYLLWLQQNSVDKFIVNNNGDVVMSKAGTSILDVKDGANTILNVTNSGAGTASLQVEGSSVAVVNGANQQIIQTGRTCEATASTGFVSITFPTVFSATPIINGMIDKNNVGTTTEYVFIVNPATDLTTTTAKLTFNANNFSGIECVHWIAIGQK